MIRQNLMGTCGQTCAKLLMVVMVAWLSHTVDAAQDDSDWAMPYKRLHVAIKQAFNDDTFQRELRKYEDIRKGARKRLGYTDETEYPLQSTFSAIAAATLETLSYDENFPEFHKSPMYRYFVYKDVRGKKRQIAVEYYLNIGERGIYDCQGRLVVDGGNTKYFYTVEPSDNIVEGKQHLYVPNGYLAECIQRCAEFKGESRISEEKLVAEVQSLAIKLFESGEISDDIGNGWKVYFGPTNESHPNNQRVCSNPLLEVNGQETFRKMKALVTTKYLNLKNLEPEGLMIELEPALDAIQRDQLEVSGEPQNKLAWDQILNAEKALVNVSTFLHDHSDGNNIHVLQYMRMQYTPEQLEELVRTLMTWVRTGWKLFGVRVRGRGGLRRILKNAALHVLCSPSLRATVGRVLLSPPFRATVEATVDTLVRSGLLILHPMHNRLDVLQVLEVLEELEVLEQLLLQLCFTKQDDERREHAPKLVVEKGKLCFKKQDDHASKPVVEKGTPSDDVKVETCKTLASKESTTKGTPKDDVKVKTRKTSASKESTTKPTKKDECCNLM